MRRPDAMSRLCDRGAYPRLSDIDLASESLLDLLGAVARCPASAADLAADEVPLVLQILQEGEVTPRRTGLSLQRAMHSIFDVRPPDLA